MFSCAKLKSMNWTVLLLVIFKLIELGFAFRKKINQFDDKFMNEVDYLELADFFAQRPDLAANRHCRRKAELNLFRQAMDTIHCPKDEFMSYLRSMETAGKPSTKTFYNTERIRNNYKTLNYEKMSFTSDMRRFGRMFEAIKKEAKKNCSTAKETLARLLSYLVREENCSRFISESLGCKWHFEDRSMSSNEHSDARSWFNNKFPEENPLNNTPVEWYGFYIASIKNKSEELMNLKAFRGSSWMNVDKCPASYDYFVASYFLEKLKAGKKSSCFYDMQQDLIKNSECLEWEKKRSEDFLHHLEMANKTDLCPRLGFYFARPDTDCSKEQQDELDDIIKNYFNSTIQNVFSTACLNILRKP